MRANNVERQSMASFHAECPARTVEPKLSSNCDRRAAVACPLAESLVK